ncbi:hypothetical protein BUALT_Bualt08G0095900 [Buddleja alternifolia]|uniref:Transposase n=1 Tax=Buddleja alternifolia TaxID=168488 RepID=A0AAV6XC63_9LAMI|nr:hypothetical protein BUALT_Bualt08G0095900 [Buddleja alternifolia]
MEMVSGVCDANLKFLYVLPGWEGSASDARVLRDALQRPNCLKVCKDKYYLVDAGYTNGPGFLAPYRATRYHLNEWRGNTPTNYKELYNLRHSSTRNAIERTFALKNKKQSYVSWNKEMDSHLAKVLTDQMVQGNKCDGDTWKPQALQAVVAYLNSTLHLTLTKDNIKNRLKNWKKYFSVVSDIQTRQSGFTWDEERKMIVVTSDEWSAWTTYVESHPDAKGLHNKMIDNWDDIVLLCGKVEQPVKVLKILRMVLKQWVRKRKMK